MNQDKHPQKRSRPPLKNNSKKAEEKDKIVISKSQNNELELIIKEALKDMINHPLKRPLRSRKDIHSLVNICTEYMQSFILMGYDMNEEAIEPIFFAQNDLQADALTSYLQKYFISMMRSGDL